MSCTIQWKNKILVENIVAFYKRLQTLSVITYIYLTNFENIGTKFDSVQIKMFGSDVHFERKGHQGNQSFMFFRLIKYWFF